MLFRSNQYLVLLLEIQPDDINIVLDRIQANWGKGGGAPERLRIECETVPLEA